MVPTGPVWGRGKVEPEPTVTVPSLTPKVAPLWPAVSVAPGPMVVVGWSPTGDLTASDRPRWAPALATLLAWASWPSAFVVCGGSSNDVRVLAIAESAA